MRPASLTQQPERLPTVRFLPACATLMVIKQWSVEQDNDALVMERKFAHEDHDNHTPLFILTRGSLCITTHWTSLDKAYKYLLMKDNVWIKKSL
jgi:hypothetical protein